MRNVYDSHPLMIDSGTFWRCDHGSTGIGSNFSWRGCFRCALWRPIKAIKAWWQEHRT